MGYRFFETAAEEGLIDYDTEVIYPFGYGLSYTSFTQEMGDMKVDNGEVSFDVNVTNVGSVPGKDVVQVYFTPPYTNGGIEKASVNLVAFAKTGAIEPGKSEKLTIRFALEDMASYDYLGEGCYVLEQGEYIISIRSDSHNVLDSQSCMQPGSIVYDANNPRSTDDSPAVNRLGFANSDVEYLSRADHLKVTAAQAKSFAAELGDENLGSEEALHTRLFQYELRNDIIPLVESRYSTYAGGDTGAESLKASREHRAYAGLSMGSMTSFHSILMGNLDIMAYVGSFSGCKTDYELFKKILQEKFADQPIRFWYNGNGFPDVLPAAGDIPARSQMLSGSTCRISLK